MYFKYLKNKIYTQFHPVKERKLKKKSLVGLNGQPVSRKYNLLQVLD